MKQIILKPARNGVIKEIIDDNHGGSNSSLTFTDVYEMDEETPNSRENIARFLYELCEDLGLNTGNKFSSSVMSIGFDWGSHYEPSTEDLDLRIKQLRQEIEVLKSIKNDKV